jgi:hypothetical protein
MVLSVDALNRKPYEPLLVGWIPPSFPLPALPPSPVTEEKTSELEIPQFPRKEEGVPESPVAQENTSVDSDTPNLPREKVIISIPGRHSRKPSLQGRGERRRKKHKEEKREEGG